MVKIENERCNRCGICTEICPNLVFVRNNDEISGEIIIVNQNLCCKCGHCVLYCPHNAVRHEAILEEAIAKRTDSNINAADIEHLMMERRSVRCFKTDGASKDQIERLIKVATNAGTASNLQSECIIVVRDPRLLDQLEKMSINILWNKGLKYAKDRSLIGRWIAKCYPPELFSNFKRYHDIIVRRKDGKKLEGMIFRKAPCLIVLCGYKTEQLSPVNCALAIRNMELLAAANGLGTCWAGLFITAARMSRKKINKVLRINDSQQVFGALMVGYPKYRPGRIVHRKPRNVRWL